MEAFEQTQYVVRRKVWQLFGQSFHIYDQQGRLLMYSKLKAFKLKEDIRVYSGESMSRELLTIHARSILDIGATYDVLDGATHERIGSARRVALASMFGRDTWKLLDAQEHEIGEIVEDSLGLALLRKWLLGALLPQTYHGRVDGQLVLTFRQRFNMFVQKMELDFSVDRGRVLDRRLGIAAAILMIAIEGRQRS